jgi:hypothetical protein
MERQMLLPLKMRQSSNLINAAHLTEHPLLEIML